MQGDISSNLAVPLSKCETNKSNTAGYCNWVQRVNPTSIDTIHVPVYKPNVLLCIFSPI